MGDALDRPERARGKLIELGFPSTSGVRAHFSRAFSIMSPRTPSRAQIDLFPEHPVIERLDPRAVVGPRTAAQAVIRVRMRTVESPHLVFHDRHGWYCETHGASCEAVVVAREAPAPTLS